MMVHAFLFLSALRPRMWPTVGSATATVPIIVIVAAAIGLLAVGIRSLRARISGSLFGMMYAELHRYLKSDQYRRDQRRPKSLGGMDRIIGPRIARDFPTLNLDEMKSAAKKTLRATLESLTEGQVLPMEMTDALYREKLASDIEKNDHRGFDVRYENIGMHGAVISDYKKGDGLCRIEFHVAYEADYTETDDRGKLIAGDDRHMTQMRASMSLLYIQDLSKITSKHPSAFAANCPNCGAPLDTFGSSACAYCGSPIDPIHLRVWRFNDYVLNV